MELNGAVALVTGGASGLGRATAELFADAGARVVVADLPHKREAVDESFGDRVTFVPVDITEEAEVVEAVRAATDIGPLRIVVSCAGMPDQRRLLGSRGPVDIEAVRRVMDVNFIGTVSVLAQAANAMQHNDPVDGDRGVVVLVSSAAGLDSSSVPYGGSKAAVAGITLAAARELASRQIRVVSIAPGIFETAMVEGMSQGAVESIGKPVFPTRLGQSQEFARLACHIVENPMFNGEVVRLDGGLRAPAMIQ